MKRNNRVIIALVLMLMLLIFNFVTYFIELFDYQNRVESGNARWKQVEERIVNIENEVDILKREVEKWKN